MNIVLEVPGQSDALSLVQSHARSLAALAGFDDTRAQAIELACEEAFGRIVERTQANPDDDPVRIRAELGALALTVTFDDQASPPEVFDDASGAGHAADIDAVDLGAVSRRLIRAAADEVTWVSRGRQGYRTRLVFNRPQRTVASIDSQAALQAFDEGVALAPPQDYTVRLAGQDTDWHQIARAMYRTYGYTYPIDDFYVPDGIRELNHSGLVLSAVAVTAGGEVVGHYALDVQGFGQFGVQLPFTGELGKAVVDPAHRSRGLMERMRRFVEDEARQRGMTAVFSEPTMAHPFSQKANESLGSRACGVLLGLVASHLLGLKAIDSAAPGQRTSVMFYHQPLGPQAARRVYAPAVHRQMLWRTYEGCDMAVQDAAPAGPLVEHTDVTVQYVPLIDIGLIAVRGVGHDVPQRLRQSLQQLVREAGARVIYLSLRLDDPGCPAACEAAERLGFHYSALCPLFDDGHDVLRLQYVNVPIDFNALAVAGPFAREIVDYVQADRARVDAL
jgi:anti-sigma regulatory factor (Ser/Thr protein kinase)